MVASGKQNGVATNGHANGHTMANGQNGHHLSNAEAVYAAGLAQERPRGTHPHAIGDAKTQVNRVLRIVKSRKTDLERYEVLNQLRNLDTPLFYQTVIDNLPYCTPLIYTPTIGEACLKWHEIYTGAEKGLFVTCHDVDNFDAILRAFPQPDVEIAVVTDGSRILGLGDLGANGMGIPIGKLSLYVACAGIDPSKTLPISLDFGTNNEALLADPSYMGLRQRRLTDEQALPIVQKFLDAFHRRWPKSIVQFEDFRSELAFSILEAQREQRACFNDDIQGTAAVALSGFIRAIQLSGKPNNEQRFVFFGAGSAAIGIGQLMAQNLVLQGMPEDEARRRFYFVDSKGLVAHNRGDKLPDHKLYFARDEPDAPRLTSLMDVINFVKPTGLLGLSTIGGAFTADILQRMAELNRRPIIFALSNPSVKSECTFEQAMNATEGRCLFASGSPFPPLIWKGKAKIGGQGNNMYIFPGLGAACIIARVRRIPETLIHAASQALAASLNDEERADDLLYPMLNRIREVSVEVARGVIRAAQKAGVDSELSLREKSDDELEAYIRSRMWTPTVLGNANHL